MNVENMADYMRIKCKKSIRNK